MKLDGFLVAMLAAVAMAWWWPMATPHWGPLDLEALSHVGVAAVFFLHGVMLSPRALRDGMMKWRLHLLVQSATFVIFPLLGWLIYHLLAAWMSAELRLGFFVLCAMASTISSSVALTAMARGDVPAAIFNASISGLIGMLITPLLLQLIHMQGAHAISLASALRDIFMTLTLPLLLGQLLRSWLAPRLMPHRQWLSLLDRGVIVLIVYVSFCESASTGVWQSFGWHAMLITVSIVGLLLAIMLLMTGWLARRGGFSEAEQITAVFCGSKKSLATGASMTKILFAGHPGLGVIMLPLMLYHQIQLLVCTALAQRYARRAEATAADDSTHD